MRRAGAWRRPARWLRGGAAAGLVALMAAPAAAQDCAIELILAVDVSGSIDGEEWRLQSGGLASAFEDPAVADAIERMEGGLLVTYTQWSGTSRQKQVVPWYHVTDAPSAQAFAEQVRGAGRVWRNFSTAVGDALAHARAVSATAPRHCRRRVVDMSGDGVSNEGRHPIATSRAMAAEGYQINALVIRGATPDPVPHYENVIGGPGAFIEIANGFEDYPRAIRRKILREIDQNLLVSEAPEGG